MLGSVALRSAAFYSASLEIKLAIVAMDSVASGHVASNVSARLVSLVRAKRIELADAAKAAAAVSARLETYEEKGTDDEARPSDVSEDEAELESAVAPSASRATLVSSLLIARGKPSSSPSVASASSLSKPSSSRNAYVCRR